MKTIVVSGYAYPSIEPWVLSSWLPDLTFLGNFSYGITTEGGVVDLKDENLTAAANGAGVKPLMVLTPLDETGTFNDVTAGILLSNPQARTNLVNNILQTIQTKGLAGIDFDFEFVPVENRQDYVELIRQTKEALAPLGYYVTAALAPKTSDAQQGSIYQGHDYRQIGEIVDYALIMTYEWGYTYGPPMAVSPINQVRKVLDYAVSEIPKEKILMGMPNYGYDWRLPFVKGETRAEKMSSEGAFWRSQYYNAEVVYDQLSQAPYFTYFDPAGNKHVVWFEDIRSIRAKLALVEEYDLAGVGYWNIMDYFPANSEVLNEMYVVRKL
ncbi:MAG: glycosyl hydrolase family 18 protein [Emergencia sp.]|nr:glycosyl hydrolase family 18 protein [Emergencia sp.]